MFLGKNIVISGPSGSGKSTILNHLLSKIPKLSLSISCTTRNPRYNEFHGKDYYFISKKIFLKNIIMNHFIEWEEVYSGIKYGTLKKEVKRIWYNKNHSIFDVDVKGALNIKKIYPKKTLTIFIKTPSINELFFRLKKRKTESEDEIITRIKKSIMEMSYSSYFDIVIINNNIEICKKIIQSKIINFIK